MNKINVIHHGKDGNRYPLEFGYAVAAGREIPADREQTLADCKDGCPNYEHNGGCPPHAVSLEQADVEDALVLYVRLFTEHYPPEVLAGPFDARSMFSERFLTDLANRVGLRVAGRLGGVLFGAGQCKGCSPDDCCFARGKTECERPERRWVSLSGAGILAGETIEKFFGLKLLWWNGDEPDFTPEYAMKLLVVGMAGKDEKDAEIAVRAALKEEGLSG